MCLLASASDVRPTATLAEPRSRTVLPVSITSTFSRFPTQTFARLLVLMSISKTVQTGNARPATQRAKGALAREPPTANSVVEARF